MTDKQVVRVAVKGVVLSYVWKGEEPLVIGDVVWVRNPDARERATVPSVKGTVLELNAGQYKGYLVVIQRRAEEFTMPPRGATP